jgi:hypothetical protein
MEQRFSYDFSRVRVHSGGIAEQSALDVNADAYTVGNDIVFGAGRFAPATQEGRRLIAHELTHVVQQSEGSLVGPSNERSGLSHFATSADQVMAERQPAAMPRRERRLSRKGKDEKDASDPALEQMKKGQFAEVLSDLNGMPMEYMLKRLQKIQNADLEMLMVHIDAANPLGEKSKNRMAAAIGAVHMSRMGVDTGKLDELDNAMEKATMPGRPAEEHPGRFATVTWRRRKAD